MPRWAFIKSVSSTPKVCIPDDANAVAKFRMGVFYINW